MWTWIKNLFKKKEQLPLSQPTHSVLITAPDDVEPKEAVIAQAPAATWSFSPSVHTNYPQQERIYNACTLNSGHQTEVMRICQKIEVNKQRFQAVAEKVGCPWIIVALISQMESGLNFNTLLHNGDPLTGRTIHVPKGYPKTGKPPFTWEEGAIDALELESVNKWTDWSLGGSLEFLERYNGLGPRKRGFPSAYIWSYTSEYKCGKYIADGVWSSTAVSGQCGVAAILKGMELYWPKVLVLS